MNQETSRALASNEGECDIKELGLGLEVRKYAKYGDFLVPMENVYKTHLVVLKRTANS